MMKFPKHCVLYAAIVIFLVGGVAESSETTLAKRHSTSIFLVGPNTQEDFSKVLVGSGITGVNQIAQVGGVSSGEIFWTKNRERIDELGIRHVFYRQLFTPSIDSEASGSVAARSGVWLVGAELGLHYENGNRLVTVLGTQFERVLTTSTPTIGQASDAYLVAQEAVRTLPGFSSTEPEEWPSSILESQLSWTKLLLHSEDQNGRFRYVWEVPTLDDSGSEHMITIDAEDGSLLSVENRILYSECSPENTTQDSAIGVPQNTAIDDRSVWATRTNDDRGGDFTHDAHKKPSGNAPDIQIWMGTAADTCDPGIKRYAVLPLETDSSSGKPIYDDNPNTIDVQNVGADAMFFTERTMVAFDDWGWDGWDDAGSDAVVIVDSNKGCYDNAFFNSGAGTDYSPPNSVNFCPRRTPPAGTLDYSLAAAIDIVAHEWGHGVVHESAGWANTGNGSFYHEGFADIIGHAVEWRTQPSGTGSETEDWEAGEDRNQDGTGIRPANEDDGDPDGGYSYHANDPATYSVYGHNEGHRLTVAFFLMADGDQAGTSNDHKNPWCATDSQNDDCHVTVPDIGINKATRIFFYGLTNLATSSTDWEDFSDLMQLAAFYVYRNCPNSFAQSEQNSAYFAFNAIGYAPVDLEYFICW